MYCTLCTYICVCPPPLPYLCHKSSSSPQSACAEQKNRHCSSTDRIPTLFAYVSMTLSVMSTVHHLQMEQTFAQDGLLCRVPGETRTRNHAPPAVHNINHSIFLHDKFGALPAVCFISQESVGDTDFTSRDLIYCI